MEFDLYRTLVVCIIGNLYVVLEKEFNINAKYLREIITFSVKKKFLLS